MKAPKYPSKPYPPYKPAPPAKTVEENTTLDTFEVPQHTTYTLEDFNEEIKKAFGKVKTDLDLKSVKLEFEVEKEWCYDDCTTTIMCNLFSQRQVPNPHLEILTEQYNRNLEKYNKELAKFDLAEEKFKKDMKIYEVELVPWQLEQAKLHVKKLENQLKKKEKK